VPLDREARNRVEPYPDGDGDPGASASRAAYEVAAIVSRDSERRAIAGAWQPREPHPERAP
jgi:hypothetical protein